MEGEEDKAFHELELVEEMMKSGGFLENGGGSNFIWSNAAVDDGICFTILVNTLSCELILSFFYFQTPSFRTKVQVQPFH